MIRLTPPNYEQYIYKCRAHSAQNNQTYPTYGEITYALWDGRSGEAPMHYQAFDSSYHIRINR